MNSAIPRVRSARSACFRQRARKLLSCATKTCNSGLAGSSVYPHEASAVTNRTPSPGGLHRHIGAMSPAIFFAGLSEAGPRRYSPNINKGQALTGAVNKKGKKSCGLSRVSQELLCLRLQDAETASVSRPPVVRRLEARRPLSRMAASRAEQLWEQGQTCSSVSLRPTAATETDHFDCWFSATSREIVSRATPRCAEGFMNVLPGQGKKIVCSTRS